MILRADRLTVRFGARAAVDDITLELRRGEFCALVGPNGAGKTTLVRAVAGLIPAQGEIAFDGRALAAMTLRERARLIAYLPQGHVFHWPVTAAVAVGLGRHPHADPFGRMTEADADAVARALAATDATDFAERSVATLSGGERARVALARALATEAPLLLADEPVASLDPRHQLIVMALLRRVTKNGGAVLAVTHDLALAARFADRVLVMDEGRIVADGPPAETLTPPLLAEVFGVDARMLALDDESIPIATRPL